MLTLAYISTQVTDSNVHVVVIYALGAYQTQLTSPPGGDNACKPVRPIHKYLQILYLYFHYSLSVVVHSTNRYRVKIGRNGRSPQLNLYFIIRRIGRLVITKDTALK